MASFTAVTDVSPPPGNTPSHVHLYPAEGSAFPTLLIDFRLSSTSSLEFMIYSEYTAVGTVHFIRNRKAVPGYLVDFILREWVRSILTSV